MYKVTIVDESDGSVVLESRTGGILFSVLNENGSECGLFAECPSGMELIHIGYGAKRVLDELYEDNPVIGFAVEHIELFGGATGIDVGAVRRGLQDLKRRREEGSEDS